MSRSTTILACAVCSVAVMICAGAPVAAQGAQASPQRRDAPPAVAAPSPTPSPTPSPLAATGATGEPDLSITANVTARELRFEVVPTPKVEFPGRPRRDTVWEAERTNLPPQVQPGVTYRDLGIRLKITSVFADIERIVAEALGEIPASSDDAPPQTDSNQNARPPDGNAQAANAASQPDDARPSNSLTQTSPASSSQATRARSGNAPTRRVKP